MPTPKIHKHSSQVTADPIIPDYVREQYQREGLRGTMRLHAPERASALTSATELTCKLCLRELANAI